MQKGLNEVYHIYNRGVDKRDVFADEQDLERFFLCMKEFNVVKPIGSIYELRFGSSTPKSEPTKPLVRIIAYCLNKNHYHLVLQQIQERGIEKFMQRLGTGYTNYFNERNNRSGALFQGRYKAKHIDSNEYLLYVSAYVNLNFRVHELGSSTPKLWRSSWGEYIGLSQESFCRKDIILEQFKGLEEYKKYSESALVTIQTNKMHEKDLAALLLE